MISKLQFIHYLPAILNVTLKRKLCLRHLPYVPASFEFPQELHEFGKYVHFNPKAQFMSKAPTHHGIR